MASFSIRRRVGVVLLCCLVPLVCAADLSSEFARAWQDAGKDEAKKREVLARIAAKKSTEAVRILVDVALLPDEPGSVVDDAIGRLAEMDGGEGDGYMRAELKRGSGRWADRAIMVRAFGRRSAGDAGDVLRGCIADHAWQVAATAIETLRHHASRETVEALLDRWSKLDPKDDASGRLGGDIRDTLLVITEKDFQTVADAKSWWSASSAAWKPSKKKRDLIESSEPGTQERAPRLFDDIASHRVIFVLDTSGSMMIPTGAAKDKAHPKGLTRMEVLIREVHRVIEDLPPAATFNVITFGTKVLPWKGKLVPAGDSNKRGAVRFVDKLRPDGETNTYGALEASFKCPDVDTIYFLSDGYPTVGKVDFNVILADVKKWNAARSVRIHSIAFIAGDGKPLKIIEGDKSLPKEFMRRLAQENGGRYKLVE